MIPIDASAIGFLEIRVSLLRFLLRNWRGDGIAPFVAYDARQRHLVVVLEDAEPRFAVRAREQRLLALEQFERVEVVAHHPCGPEVPRRRDDVGKVDRVLASAFDRDELGVIVVPANGKDADAGDDLGLALDRLELSGANERLPVFGKIARALAL